MVEVAGVEPEGQGVNPFKQAGLSSAEALIKILTNLPDVDRLMLSQIVERWGGLSDELKRAVLRVVGFC